MRHRHHSESVEALAALLKERHGVELSAEDLTGALKSLDMQIAASGKHAPAGTGRTDEPGGLVCIDGPEGCEGDVTTLLDARHVRCERHWSLFLESEGM